VYLKAGKLSPLTALNSNKVYLPGFTSAAKGNELLAFKFRMFDIETITM
jgi:hypothetical protein